MLRKLDLPPVWLAGFAALVWAQPRLFGPVGLGRWGEVLGAGLIGAGLALMAAAGVEFLRHRTTIVPHRMPAALVTTGIYRLSRNPIYLGDALILAGLALLWQALPALVLVPVFVWLINARFIRGEEARLAARFGADFAAWRDRVRRWL
jgi:protein-S-isoprenylcysteine O-methyltransferase Ste14